MAYHADEGAFFIDHADLVEVVGKHQGPGFEQGRGASDGHGGMGKDLLCGDGVHPRNVPIHGFFRDHFEQINRMNTTHWRTVLVNDEDMVPIVFGEDIEHCGHGVTPEQRMRMLHDVSTQHLAHLFSGSCGLVGLAKKRSGCHGFSTAPVSRPFLNPSEKPP